MFAEKDLGQKDTNQTAMNAASSGQPAVPSAQGAQTLKPENLKEKRDGGRVTDRVEDKASTDAARATKDQYGANAPKKGASLTQDDGQYSAKDTKATQGKTNGLTGNGQSLTSTKSPFLGELSQSLTGGESKPIQVTTTQLQTGLLSFQEVGQTNQSANPLSPAGLVRQTLTPFTPPYGDKPNRSGDFQTGRGRSTNLQDQPSSC